MIFLGAKQNTNRRIVVSYSFVCSEPVEVGVELAQVLVGEAAHLQLDEHMAFQETVIKNEIHEEMLTADQQTFLACLEAEAAPQFQQERLQLVQERVFQ